MECYDSAVDEPSIDILISYVYEYLPVQFFGIPFFHLFSSLAARRLCGLSNRALTKLE